MAGQDLRRALADVADGKPVNEAPQALGPGLVDGLDQVAGGFLPESGEAFQLGECQPEQIRRLLDQALREKELGRFFAQALYVEGVFVGEMNEPGLYLGLARGVDAARDRLSRLSGRGLAANRAGPGEFKRGQAFRALGEIDLDNLRYDVSGPLEAHHVAGPHILSLELVLIVKSGLGDGDPAYQGRLEPGHRRQGPRAAHLDLYGQDPGHDGSGLELGGDSVSGGPRGGSEPWPKRQIVNRDDQAVDLVRQVVAVGLQALKNGQDFREAPGASGGFRGLHRKTPLPEPFHEAGVCRGARGVGVGQAVSEKAEAPASGDFGVKLP